MPEKRYRKGAVSPKLEGGAILLKLLDSLPYYVMLVNEDHEILLVNKALREEYGMEPNEVIGGYCPEVIHGASGPISKCPLEESARMENPQPASSIFSEEGRWLKSAVYPVNDLEYEGKNVFFHTVHDITKRKEAEKKLEQATFGTLQALNRTIEAKDEYTGEHIDRVQEFSVKIGKKVGLSEERLEQLRYASILHDIGKIGVPDLILGKPDKLTEDEWAEMKKHPEIGERIVGQVNHLSRAAKIIGQHQEKYDGSGYPKGLEGEEITLEARIVAVADAWDAMRTARPYREALPKEEALKEVRENKGTQFDPEVVDILLEMIKEREVGLE